MFGCPVFILDPCLQDSKKILNGLNLTDISLIGKTGKRGVYLGVSPFHLSAIHFVQNPSTGSITPQYHLDLDDFLYSLL